MAPKQPMPVRRSSRLKAGGTAGTAASPTGPKAASRVSEPKARPPNPTTAKARYKAKAKRARKAEKKRARKQAAKQAASSTIATTTSPAPKSPRLPATTYVPPAKLDSMECHRNTSAPAAVFSPKKEPLSPFRGLHDYIPLPPDDSDTDSDDSEPDAEQPEAFMETEDESADDSRDQLDSDAATTSASASASDSDPNDPARLYWYNAVKDIGEERRRRWADALMYATAPKPTEEVRSGVNDVLTSALAKPNPSLSTSPKRADAAAIKKARQEVVERYRRAGWDAGSMDMGMGMGRVSKRAADIGAAAHAYHRNTRPYSPRNETKKTPSTSARAKHSAALPRVFNHGGTPWFLHPELRQPFIPMDLSPFDPKTLDVYNDAVRTGKQPSPRPEVADGWFGIIACRGILRQTSARFREACRKVEVEESSDSSDSRASVMLAESEREDVGEQKKSPSGLSLGTKAGGKRRPSAAEIMSMLEKDLGEFNEVAKRYLTSRKDG